MSQDTAPTLPTPPDPAGPALDAQGHLIIAGALVRILVIPLWLTHDLPEEDVVLLKETEGTLMRVLEIDAFGYVWFGKLCPWFCLRPEEVEVQTLSESDI